MKALTLHQPWASLIALGVKTIETRSWSTDYRGPLAIHAGTKSCRRLTDDPYGMLGDWWVVNDEGEPALLDHRFGHGTHADLHALPLGAVVATCTLVDVVPITDHAETGEPECVVIHDDGIDHCIPSFAPPPGPPNVVRLDEPDIPEGTHLIRDVSDQQPYGDFSPGRFAWLLADIEPVDPPVSARGRQRLWNLSDDWRSL